MPWTAPARRRRTAGGAAERDEVAGQQRVAGQPLPLALPVHLDGLLGRAERAQLAQVAQPLADHRALEHHQHAQRK